MCLDHYEETGNLKRTEGTFWKGLEIVQIHVLLDTIFLLLLLKTWKEPSDAFFNPL